MSLVLPVSIFVLVALGAYMGVHVTMHPPETALAKRWWKIGFCLTTLIAAVLIGLQTIKATREANILKLEVEQLTRSTGVIERQTKQSPTISVNVPPAVVQIMPAPQPVGSLREPSRARPDQERAESKIPARFRVMVRDEDCTQLIDFIAQGNQILLSCRLSLRCDPTDPKTLAWRMQFREYADDENPYLFALFATASSNVHALGMSTGEAHAYQRLVGEISEIVDFHRAHCF